MHCKDINWWLLLALLGVGVAFSLFLVYWKKSEVGVRGCLSLILPFVAVRFVHFVPV